MTAKPRIGPVPKLKRNAAEITLDGETHRFGPGSFVAASIGTVHGFRNSGDGELRLLNLSAPNTGFAEGLRG